MSEEEIATIATWVDSGAPRGNPDDMPPPRDFAESGRWSIGTPDLIVVSEDVTVRAVAPDYWGLLDPSPTRLGEDRFIKAVEVREVRVQQAPTERVTRRAEGDLNYFVLHHATVAAQDQMQEGAEDEQRAPQEGSNFSVTYELGQNATVFPDAIGVKLSAGSSLMYRVHLHSVGEEIQFRIEVGFKLHPKGYEPKYTHSANIAGIFPTYELDIPGNQNDVRVDGMTVISKPSLMLTFEPHLHSSGKRMCVTAVYPDGASETLNCAGYNHNWVKVYVYEDDAAPLLPAGTILQIVAWYDNTAGNPRVVDSRNWKGFGNRSIDDMFAFLPRMVELTDEEFRQEVAARKARYLRQYPTANDN